MTGPEVRDEITALALRLSQIATRLIELEAELHRRSPVRVAKPRRKTPPKAVILSVVADNPNLDQCGVAQVLGTNPGRVSEALRGKRA